jgi:hypothetical protein
VRCACVEVCSVLIKREIASFQGEYQKRFEHRSTVSINTEPLMQSFGYAFDYQYMVRSLRSALCALRSALCALRSALCALRSALCALRSALCNAFEADSQSTCDIFDVGPRVGFTGKSGTLSVTLNRFKKLEEQNWVDVDPSSLMEIVVSFAFARSRVR